MQTQTQIRQLLAEAGLAPNKALGQNFLIDRNLMDKLLLLAGVGPEDVVLEVGPGTGSLTEELAQRARRVVAVEIDRGLHSLLQGRLANRNNVLLLHADVLAGKHELSPAVLDALGGRACLVSNLPYHVATPVVAECLLLSHRTMRSGRVAGILPASAAAVPTAVVSSPSVSSPFSSSIASSLAPAGGMPAERADKMSATRAGETPATPPAPPCLFPRLTFTVQRELADRMSAAAGEEAYGPFSAIVAILAKVTPGPLVPPSAFWPRPSVSSRIVRIDFDPPAALRLEGAAALTAILGLAFGQRRKQVGSLLRRKDSPFEAEALAGAFERAGVAKTLRAEQISPGQYLEIANALHGAASEFCVPSSEF